MTKSPNGKRLHPPRMSQKKKWSEIECSIGAPSVKTVMVCVLCTSNMMITSRSLNARSVCSLAPTQPIRIQRRYHLMFRVNQIRRIVMAMKLHRSLLEMIFCTMLRPTYHNSRIFGRVEHKANNLFCVPKPDISHSAYISSIYYNQ